MTLRILTLTRQDILGLLSLFLLGCILGGTAVGLVVGKHMDSLIQEKEDLEEMVANQDIRLEKMAQSLRSHEERRIQDLEVHLEGSLDRHLLRDLERQITELLYQFVGRPINELDPSGLLTLLEERVFYLEGRPLEIHVRLIVMADIMTFYLEAQPAPP